MAAATAALVRIGAWNYVNETFIPHPSSPTSAIFDINDGVTFSLVDSGGHGDGLDLGSLEPTLFTSSNPRVVGEVVKKRVYTKNRKIVAKLLWGQGTVYATWITALHNLVGLCEGITPDLPGVLLVQTTLSSTPIYFDIVGAWTNVKYEELKYQQMLVDSVEVTFMVKPFARGPRQTLQNLVNNPGFEVPSGPGVTMFTDSLANTNAYTEVANPFLIETLAQAPVRYYRLGNSVGATSATDSNLLAANSQISATVSGTVTFGGGAALSGDSTTSATFDGTTGYCQTSTMTNLPTGAAAWSLFCWCYVTAYPGTTRTLMSFGLNSTAHGSPQFTMDSSGRVALSDATTATAVSAALSQNAWHFLAGTYDGTTLRMYVDGAAGNTAAATVAIPGASTFLTLGATSLGSPTLFFPGRLQECAFFNVTLSATEISTLYQQGKGTFSPAALTTDTTRYNDVVQADSPLRYYRCDEISGAAIDATRNDGGASFYGGAAPTYGVTGALTSDTDTAVTFAGGTDITIPTTGLPTGNTAFTLECWGKISANPTGGTYYTLVSIGDNTGSNTYCSIFINSTGQVYVEVGTTITQVGFVAFSTGTWHHVVATWDGTTLKLYLDGASVGTPATPGIRSLHYGVAYFGVNYNGSSFLTGSLDECAIFGTALSPTRVTAHYNAGHNAPTTNSTSMTIAAGAQVGFGQNWQNMNQWRVRFRYVTGQTAIFAPMYNFNAGGVNQSIIYFQINGSSLSCNQIFFGGSARTLANTAITLINEIEYWLTITIFPGQLLTSGIASYLGGTVSAQWTIAVDSGGSPGSTVATSSLSLLMSNGFWIPPVIATSGTTLSISATPANAAMSVSQFGPGGWYFSSTGTGQASANWYQATSSGGSVPNTTIPGLYQTASGPIASFGAMVIMSAPAGTFGATLTNADLTSATTIQNTAIPVNAGDVLGINVQVTASYNNSTHTLVVNINILEYNSSGSYLRTGVAATGSYPSYAFGLPVTYITGANCAYVVLQLQGTDVAGNGSGGVIAFDNVQVWNRTQTGQTTMPYCELRFPQSFALATVSGVIGDGPAPALVALNMLESSFLANGTITYYIGRRSSSGIYQYPIQTQSSGPGILDSTAYGGYAISTTGLNSTTYFSPTIGGDVTNTLGGYHYLTRMQITSGTPTTAGLQSVFVGSTGYTYLASLPSFTQYAVASASMTPFAAQNAWTIADTGVATIPITPQGSRAIDALFSTQFVLSNATAALVNVSALLPNDTETMIGTVTNGTTPYTNVFITAYHDGVNQSTSITSIGNGNYGGGVGFTPVYSNAIISAGTPLAPFTIANYSNNAIVTTGTTIPYVDPKLSVPGSISTNVATTGVNQWVIVAQDSAGKLLPIYLEVSYSPQYWISL